MEMANTVMEVWFEGGGGVCEFLVSISWVCVKSKYGSHDIYVHKIRYDTAAFKFCCSFQHYYMYFSFWFSKWKKALPK